MAEVVFDKFSDIGKLEAEKEQILKIFGQVKTGVMDLNSLGFKIDSSKTIAETAKAAQQLEQVNQQLLNSQAKMDAQVERSRKLAAQASEAEAKQQLAQLRLIEAKEKAYEKEQIAIEKRNRAEAAKQQGGNTERIVELRTKALKEAEQAELDYAKSAEYAKIKQEELDAAISSGAASNNQRAQLVKPTAAVDVGDAGSLTKYKDELEELTGTLMENQQQQVKYKKEIKDIGATLKYLDANTKDSEKSTAAYQNKVAALTQKEAELKRESQQLTTTINAQTREQNSAAGSLENLRARLILAQQAFDKMDASERASPMGQRLAGTVNNLTTQVNNLEQSTGRYARNVGNYASGIGAFFGKAFSFLRVAANIIPGAGIAGILLAIYEGLKAVIESFVTFGSAAKRAGEDVHTAMQEANESVGKQIGELKTLYDITQDTNAQMDDRVDATKRILDINKANNKATGEHTQLLTDQNGVLVANAAAIDALTESLFKQAKTKAYLNLIEEAFGKVLKAQNATLGESTTKFQDFFNFFKNSGNVLDMMTGKGLGITGVLIGQAKAKQKGIEDAEAYLKAIQKQFSDGLKSGELDLSGVFKKVTDTKGKQAAEKARKDALELFKYRMGLLIEEQKALSELPAISYKYRIDARKKQAQLEKELTQGVAAFELAEADITENKRKLIRLKAATEIKDAEAAAAIGVVAIRMQTERMVLGDIEKENAASLQRRLKQKEEFERIKQNRINSLQKEHGTERDMQVNVQDFDLKNLEKQLAAGEITWEQYEANKAAIIADGNKAAILSDIQYYERLLLISDLSTEKQKEALAALQRLRHEVNATDLKEAEDIDKKKLELEQARNQAIKGLGLEALSTLQAALEGGVDAQKNKIQEQIDQVEALKNAEIDRITATTASEEEKANKIKIVEAKAQADRERLQQRQRELDRRKAMFDRAFGAFQIGIQGVESVAKIKATVLELTAKAAANPLLAPLIPIAAAQIPISIATSAAQLVALLATPLPKFATGTDNAPAGPALVGEAGRELAVEPSGKLRLYERPTIANLAAGTKILPNKVTEDVLRKGWQSIALFFSKGKEEANGTDLTPVVKELKELNKRSRIIINNQSGIETSAWYQQNLKN